MLSLSIPALYAPFEERINPGVRLIAYRTQQWVSLYQLHSDDNFDTYVDEGLSWMTARFYPSATLERLSLTDRFNTLLFALDDLMDHHDHKSEVISSRQRFEAYIDRCMKIMNGKKLDLPPTGHLSALENIWASITAMTSTAWQLRFCAGIKHMFDAALWSHDNVAANRLPSISEFYKMRPFLGAANTSTDMIEFCENVHLPASIRELPSIQELTRLCQITVCLANDLFSLSKEMAHKDKHNMVTIVQSELDLSLEDAIDYTVSMHDNDVRKFIRLAQTIPDHGRQRSALRKYIRCLTALMRGNIDWSISETGRYHFTYQYPALAQSNRTVLVPVP
ncbi:terpene synthase family protein [Chitinophaga sp. NPDC101104]|uniref:terpene synthase family protein n=1 Tax=Chitinophaga sp. NPDC101104 TaxID=3390561 RepID=UPI003CFDAD60